MSDVGRSKALLGLLAIFALALGLRLLYQSESRVDAPLRADAGKYFSAAYNLRFHGAYSEQKPARHAPDERIDLAPGYPLFLALFVDDEKGLIEFIDSVLRTQAVLGALTAVAAALLAGACLPLGWAFAAGLLTALNPHLVALDGYVLTESLFTFTFTWGLVLATWAWKSRRAATSLAAGLALALAAQVRTIGHPALFAVAPAFLLEPAGGRAPRRQGWRHVALLLVGLVIVGAAHRLFVAAFVTHEMAGARAEAPRREEDAAHYLTAGRAWKLLSRSHRPPAFYVDGLSHVYAGDMDWKLRTDENFSEAPGAYLNWNLGGRFRVMWHWDTAYNGDVYIYPMKRRGFHENALLGAVHRLARWLHWPLYLLAIAAPPLVALRWRRLAPGRRASVVPALAFACFFAIASIVWMPRYSIPFRPLSFVMAAETLWLASAWLASRRGSRPPV